MTITVVNDRPVAIDDTATSNADDSVDIFVLANDSVGPANEAGQQLTISITLAPIHGTAVVNDNCTPLDPSDDFVHYLPAADFHGIDTFLYSVCDDGTTNGGFDPKCALVEATVTVTVDPVNDAPSGT